MNNDLFQKSASIQQWRNLWRKKPIQNTSPHALHRCLSATDLTFLGVGTIIGAGIFVLTGIAAATQAGPGIILSYLLAGIACAFSAFAYAELASSVGGCGSAYGYAYAGLGEFIAWLIGWDLLLEYSMDCTTVSIGWSGYLQDALHALGITLPQQLCAGPWQGGWINLPAILIIGVIALLLAIGTRQSAKANKVIVVMKLAIILLFMIIAAKNFNPANWHPFFPFGASGIVHGAALIFFAYIGFDAVSTAAEETINPARNLPIGIILSLVICTVIYIAVAGLLTGMAHYSTLNVSSPVANTLIRFGYHFAGEIVALGALAGLTTVILGMYYGLTRVFLAMARDGLLPGSLSHIRPKSGTPQRLIFSVGGIMALVAGFIPIDKVANIVNIGTLAAFIIVSMGVIFLRHSQPQLNRPFKVPCYPLFPLCGVLFSGYLMINLPAFTWKCFIAWMVIGTIIYFIYSKQHSILNKNSTFQ